MQTRKLGSQGLTVSALGLGCMGMAGTAGQAAMYGNVDPDEAVATLHRALESYLHGHAGYCKAA